jgi:hypothetical protein
MGICMTYDSARVLLAAALERLRAEMQAYLGRSELAVDSPVRANILRSLGNLEARLEDDPEWVDAILREIARQQEPPTKS